MVTKYLFNIQSRKAFMANEVLVKHSGGIHFKKAKCMGKTDDNVEIECTTTAAMVIVNGDALFANLQKFMVLKYLEQ